MAEQTIYPAADTYVNAGAPTTNYGTDSLLHVRQVIANNIFVDSYLMFNVPNVDITFVYLRLYSKRVAVVEPGTIFITNCPASWSESTLTWNKIDNSIGELETTIDVSPTQWNAWFNIDITDFCKAHKGQLISLHLTGLGTMVWGAFDSKEGTNKPNLRVIYNEAQPLTIYSIAVTPTTVTRNQLLSTTTTLKNPSASNIICDVKWYIIKPDSSVEATASSANKTILANGQLNLGNQIYSKSTVPGSYGIRVTAFEPGTTTVMVTRDFSNVFTSQGEQTATAIFQSSPSGAKITWPGQPIPQYTPYTASGVAPISLTVTYELAGYVPQTFPVSVALGATTTYNKTMVLITADTGALAGKVTNSATGANLSGVTVAIAYTLLSETTDASGNYTISNIPIGLQSATYSKTGYDSQGTSVTIAKDTTVTKNIALVQTVVPPSNGTVQLNSIPQGAAIWINGVNSNHVGPYTYTAPAGSYQIRMELTGYTTTSGTLNLTTGSNPPFTLTLPHIVPYPWWEKIIEFEADGTLQFTDESIAPINLGPWLEANYLDKPLETAAKTAFYGVLLAASGAILWTIFNAVGAAIAARWGTRLIADIPRDSEIIVERMIVSRVTDTAIANNVVASKLVEIFGTGSYLKLISRFVMAVAGVDILATWMASDNLITGFSFTLNTLKSSVLSGTITQAQALAKIAQVQAWLDYATNFVNISTLANPLLWAFRPIFMTNVAKGQVDVDLKRAEIEALSGENNGFVYIESDPTAAKIYKDGVFLFEYTNTTLTLATGTYTFTLKKTGYNDISKSITINKNLTSEWVAVMTSTVTPPAGKGTLNLSVDPAGVTISVPGQTQITAPGSYSLNPGNYIISFSKTGYWSTTRTAVITEGNITNIAVTMVLSTEPKPPEEEVIIPLEPLIPGVTQYNAWKVTVKAIDESTQQPISAWILINDIFMMVSTPYYFYLAPSSQYNIKLRAKGYSQGETTFTTKALPTQ